MKQFLKNLRGKIGFTKRKRTKGETLVEILVALFTLAIGGAAASGLIISAMKTNAGTRDDLIALNLAREGVEAIRNIRDTNWMRWSAASDKCWDIRDNSSCYNNPNKIGTGFFRVGTDQGFNATDPASFLWSLAPALFNTPLDLNVARAENDFYRLDIIDRFKEIDTDGDGNKTNDQDMYAHTTNLTKTPYEGTPIMSKYYRMVYIDHQTVNDPITAYVIVMWKDGNRIREVQLTTILTNHKD